MAIRPMSPNYHYEHCEAPSCIQPGNRISIRDKVSCIVHELIAHQYHVECLCLELSKDQEYLRSGKLTKCPTCSEKINHLLAIPDVSTVIRNAFIYQVHKNNALEIVALINTEIVQEDLIEWFLNRSCQKGTQENDCLYQVYAKCPQIQKTLTTLIGARPTPAKSTHSKKQTRKHDVFGRPLQIKQRESRPQFRAESVTRLGQAVGCAQFCSVISNPIELEHSRDPIAEDLPPITASVPPERVAETPLLPEASRSHTDYV
jgi:hypothetical protein